MKIVIIGASGLVGANILSRLKRDHVVTTISRRSIPEVAIESQIILPEFNTSQIQELDIDADIFICCLGTTIKKAGSKELFRHVDHDLVVAFSQLAKKSDAKGLFVVSALGANSKSSIFYNRVKGEMEDAISSHDHSSVYFLRPSLLIGERAEKRVLEGIGIKLYHVFENIAPKSLRSKMGTKVEDISTYVETQIGNLKSAVNVVEDFD